MGSSPLSLTYSHVYHQVYFLNVDNLHRWLDEHLFRCPSVRTRFWVSLHLMTIFRTQKSMEPRFLPCMRAQVCEAHKLASLSASLGLRILQHRILAHLWRPEGNLYQRQLRMMCPHSGEGGGG